MSSRARQGNKKGPKTKGKGKRAEEDLRDEYGAPFKILSHEEGRRYAELTYQKRSFRMCRYLDFDALKKIGLDEEVERLAAILGWEKFLKFDYNVYPRIALEFFTTYVPLEDEKRTICFRVYDEDYTLDHDQICEVFGFPVDGFHILDCEFDVHEFWKELTGLERFDITKASNGFIRDHATLVLHKFMCHAVFGKAESNKVSSKELAVLWCLQHGTKINTASLMRQAMLDMLSHKRYSLTMGHMISIIAIHLEIIDPATEMLEPLPRWNFNLDTWVSSEVVTVKHQLREPSTRRCWRDHRSTNPPVARTRRESASETQERDQEEPSTAHMPLPVEPISEPVGWQLVLDRLQTMEEQNTANMAAIHRRFDRMEKQQRQQRQNIKLIGEKYGIEFSSPPPSPPEAAE